MGTVGKIVQTKGPTIFVVTDSTGSLSLKGFEKPGDRSYPDINEGDSIKATIEIGEYNGKGISEDKISHPKSLGLLGIRERALLWDGQVKISGAQGQGTTVVVKIPLR